MKKTKKIFMVMIVLVVSMAGVAIVTMLSGRENTQATPDHVVIRETEKRFVYNEKQCIATNDKYNHDVKSFESNLDEYVAYSLDYNAELPCNSGESLSKQGELSGAIVTALKWGYPESSVEFMGLENEEEARMATQFAIWTLSQMENIDESKSLEYVFDIDNLVSEEGDERLEKIKIEAKSIVGISLEAPAHIEPKLLVDSDASKIKLMGDELIVGPYMINAKDYQITNLSISLADAPNTAVLCDAVGTPKTEFEMSEGVYVKLNKSVGKTKFSILVQTEGEHRTGIVYGTGVSDDNKQNFCVLEKVQDNIDATIDIELPEVKIDLQAANVTGTLKIVTLDETHEKKIPDMTYEIINEEGIIIDTLEPDENGEIISRKLPKGNYFYRVLSEPKDIHIDRNKYPFEITEKESVKECIHITQPAKAGIEFVFRDTKEQPVAGVKVRIFDENNNIVDTLCSDEEGKAVSKNLLLGNYTYQQLKVPKGYKEDYHEYEFSLMQSMYVLKHNIAVAPEEYH